VKLSAVKPERERETIDLDRFSNREVQLPAVRASFSFPKRRRKREKEKWTVRDKDSLWRIRERRSRRSGEAELCEGEADARSHLCLLIRK